MLFAFGSAELTPEATAIVQQLAERSAAAPPGEVGVVGHTDGIGSDADNRVLSDQRAAAVAAVLQTRLGPDRPLVTEGRGETEPVAPETVGGEDDPAGRALNRRGHRLLPRAGLTPSAVWSGGDGGGGSGLPVEQPRAGLRQPSEMGACRACGSAGRAHGCWPTAARRPDPPPRSGPGRPFSARPKPCITSATGNRLSAGPLRERTLLA